VEAVHEDDLEAVATPYSLARTVYPDDEAVSAVVVGRGCVAVECSAAALVHASENDTGPTRAPAAPVSE
jgi:hypothetical protein